MKHTQIGLGSQTSTINFYIANRPPIDDYRDLELFQSHSQEALLFSSPAFDVKNQNIHIIAGKTYAGSLNLPPLIWLDAHFALNKEHRLIVAPYPDYRQLSNERITRLITFMREL